MERTCRQLLIVLASIDCFGAFLAKRWNGEALNKRKLVSSTNGHRYFFLLRSAMSAPEVSPVLELEDELATFRREWLQEQAAKRNAPSIVALPSSPSSSSSPPTLSAVTESLDALVLEEKWRPPRAKTAIELYELAVVSEREGRLNDGELPSVPQLRVQLTWSFAALSNYRAAFRLDSDVDKAYHRASLALIASFSSFAVDSPSVPSLSLNSFSLPPLCHGHLDSVDLPSSLRLTLCAIQ